MTLLELQDGTISNDRIVAMTAYRTQVADDPPPEISRLISAATTTFGPTSSTIGDDLLTAILDVLDAAIATEQAVFDGI